MARCQRIVAETVPELRIVSPIPDWFDVMPKGMSKAASLPILLDELDITPDEVLVFGDAANDLELFGAVPNSVAVGKRHSRGCRGRPLARGASAEEGVADALFEIAVAAVTGGTPDFMKE